MRFYEFSPAEPALQRQAQPKKNTRVSPPAPPTTSPETTVQPRALLRRKAQDKLTAQITKSAQNLTPTQDDLVIAFTRFSDAQRKADAEFKEKRTATAAAAAASKNKG